jgi:hypothetical protein
MPRFIDTSSLSEASFIEQWTKLAGVSSLLSCADRTGVRIGIWGGCVRNFVLDERPLSDEDREPSLHFIDFVDPYSDIDCVVDRGEDWQLVAQAIAGSVAFAGYHRWECQTFSQVTASLHGYARIAAESFVVWHEGYDSKRQPKITIQVLEGEFESLLRAPLSRMRQRSFGERSSNPWQELLDTLRLSRYQLQYPSVRRSNENLTFLKPAIAERIIEFEEPRTSRIRNFRRFDLAVLDILMTAHDLPDAVEYLRELTRGLPHVITERESVLTQLLERYKPTLSYLGALVYRQRNDTELRFTLMTRVAGDLSYSGFRSTIPWTYLWSLGTSSDDCCRHEDFKNGVAVLSWRPSNSSAGYSQSQSLELAPAAQIAPYAPYDDAAEDRAPSVQRLFSIPGIVRAGASLTLRFDHAYMAQLLGRNVAMYVGLVNAEALG